ncbi:hypothetical protein [Geothrix sp. PMB-07]|uniref:hypothetical protein n=1 Tax=Geothrix sp. PMB-07 TaxID=3068640 RepID=UPI00274084DD|nr:hypothetical protein [Geothrix sp. PMB-07]WLT30773.1 hypothetical protein Q9293_13715 [Geothrix sp. PMB-07]
MKPADAEKLLGGYAAGTLTETERQGLFSAALEHQEVFDALADEEVLRDLLADPAARAQLLAALSPASTEFAAPKVVPFWRRTGVLGAAASLLVAATAGLAYLRSPEKVPPPLEDRKAPALKAAETPGQVASDQAPLPLARKRAEEDRGKPQDKGQKQDLAKAAPPPPEAPLMAAPAMAAPVSATDHREDSARRKEQPGAREAKKAEAPKPAAAAVMEVVAAAKEEAPQSANQAPVTRLADLPPARAVGGVAGLARGAVAPAPAPMAKAKADHRMADAISRDSAPLRWSLRPQPDGSTVVEVWAPREAHLVLLKRGTGEAAVITLLPKAPAEASSNAILWHGEVRLEAGEALDLYRLNHPAADPKKLPETGPVDGFRARIHPTEKGASR